MLLMGDTVVDPLDSVKPGDPNSGLTVTSGCAFHWTERIGSVPYPVRCTRSFHLGTQHVAEGDDSTGVIAVHAW